MKDSEAIHQNVFYSVLDYVSQPVMMLLAAPLLLRELGLEQYGTWMLVNSIAATASGLGGGFGDGATRYVSLYRGCGDRVGAVRTLVSVLAVNSAFGVFSAVVMMISAPWLIGHVFTVEPALRNVAVVAVRISAVLLVVRFAEAVFMSAIRGCERYRPMVAISVTARTAVTIAAIALSLRGQGLVAILWATLLIGLVSLASQAWLAHRILHADGIWRRVELWSGIREVSSFGAFTWLKSSLGILIGYADRLLVAALLGTGPLAYYALCNQLTQPIHALMASAFNFIFPNFSAQSASGRWSETIQRYRSATRISALFVIAFCVTMTIGARLILRLWLGAAVATQYHNLLAVMAVGNGLLALGVVPHYAALALGRARALAVINFAAGVLSLGFGYVLIRHIGLLGAGVAKIIAGIVFLAVFSVVRQSMQHGKRLQTSGLNAATNNALDFAQ